MRNPFNLPNLLLSTGFACVLPLSAQAAVVFQDSFENDGTGYNLPTPSSTPGWNTTFTGVINTTVGDSNYDKPNGGPTAISSTYITGQVGNDYVYLGNAAEPPMWTTPQVTAIALRPTKPIRFRRWTAPSGRLASLRPIRHIP